MQSVVLQSVCPSGAAYEEAWKPVWDVLAANAPALSPGELCQCENGCYESIMHEVRHREEYIATHVLAPSDKHNQQQAINSPTGHHYSHWTLHGADHEPTTCCKPLPYAIHEHDYCEMVEKKDPLARGGVKYECELIVTCPCQRHAHAHTLPYNIIVLTVMIALGNLCRFHANAPCLRALPYTVQVFGLGALWGFICMYVVGGEFGHNFGELGHLDPHLMFFIFLPLLIFESAFATEWHVFKKVIVHCLFLASFGLIISAVLTACVAKFAFGEYGWSWITCLLFGCILSATDPVAVVALLKELGAAPAISALIEGESLLNDGTAIVFFKILAASVPSGELEMAVPEAVYQLFYISCGGALLGLVAGVATAYAINSVFNDPAIEISLTLICAYGTFFIAEAYLEVSGVLGLVVAGMYLAHHSQVITPEVEHSLHHFWEIIVYMANTMIFGIAGIVIAEEAFSHVQGYDVGYVVITYVACNIIRGIALFSLRNLMNICGKYQLDVSNGLLCTWGGLRGAVGLALAVMIVGDKGILCEHKDLGSRFLFHTAGIVIFTLCVNGVTTGKVVHKLKLDAVSMSKKRSMQRTFREVAIVSTDKQQDLQRKREYSDANWATVQAKCAEHLRDNHNAPQGGKGEKLPPPEREEDACEHYYRCYHAGVEHEYEGGTMMNSSVRVLLAWLADAEDQASKGKWEMVPATKIESAFQNKGKLSSATQHLLGCFDCGIGFLNVHVYTLNHIDALCHQPQAASRVKAHCKREISATVSILDLQAKAHPEVSCSVKSKNASRHILNSMRNHIAWMRKNGRLVRSDAAVLTGQVEKNMKLLKRMPKTIPEAIYARTLNMFCPWFDEKDIYHIDPAIKAEVLQSFKIETIAKTSVGGSNAQGKKVCDKQTDGDGIRVCVAGVMAVNLGHHSEIFGPGYSAGILGGISGVKGKFCDVSADSDCVVAFFPAAVIRDLMKRSPQLSSAIWDEACRLAARCMLSSHPNYKDWGHVRISAFCNEGQRAPVRDDKELGFNLTEGYINILILGKWKDVHMDTSGGEAPYLLPKQMTTGNFWDGPVLLCIPNVLTVAEQARANWAKVAKALFIAQAIAALHTHDSGKIAVGELLAGRLKKLVAAQRDNADDDEKGLGSKSMSRMPGLPRGASSAQMPGGRPMSIYNEWAALGKKAVAPPDLSDGAERYRPHPLHEQPERLRAEWEAARLLQQSAYHPPPADRRASTASHHSRYSALANGRPHSPAHSHLSRRSLTSSSAHAGAAAPWMNAPSALRPGESGRGLGERGLPGSRHATGPPTSGAYNSPLKPPAPFNQAAPRPSASAGWGQPPAGCGYRGAATRPSVTSPPTGPMGASPTDSRLFAQSSRRPRDVTGSGRQPSTLSQRRELALSAVQGQPGHSQPVNVAGVNATLRVPTHGSQRSSSSPQSNIVRPGVKVTDSVRW